MAKARGRYLGMDLEIISVDEAARLFPLLDKKHFKGAMYDPIEGHVDPYGVTHAYAKAAEMGGAEIVRRNRVTDLKARADGTPLIGPIRGLKNFWVACGVMAGFSQGGGVGLTLAHWMVDGDPGADVWGMDVARYGAWATLGYTNAKVRENYSRRFRIRFPNEELDAARPLRTTPVYERLVAENAVFGEYCGLEHALWFAPRGVTPTESITFRRSDAHEHVAAECHAVRDAVGLLEISTYGKFEIDGPGTGEWLNR